MTGPGQNEIGYGARLGLRKTFGTPVNIRTPIVACPLAAPLVGVVSVQIDARTAGTGGLGAVFAPHALVGVRVFVTCWSRG